MVLFELFEILAIMKAIVMETNFYATRRDALGKTKASENWKKFIMAGLRAFTAIWQYM